MQVFPILLIEVLLFIKPDHNRHLVSFKVRQQICKWHFTDIGPSDYYSQNNLSNYSQSSLSWIGSILLCFAAWGGCIASVAF